MTAAELFVRLAIAALFTASDERRQHELAAHGLALPQSQPYDDGPRGLRAVIDRDRGRGASRGGRRRDL
ncbi:MAG: hypothetical protein H0W96_16490 [Solirubrobacterales bacterium]|nr:hypothetical protein [Solirubrobacterales bacterium]